MSTKLDCSGKMSRVKKSICHAAALERARECIDSNRQAIPFMLDHYDKIFDVGILSIIPKYQWEIHSNWPNQTLLLKAHRYFRGMTQDIVAGLLEIYESVPVLNSNTFKKLLTSINHQFEKLNIDLSSHASFEETHIFPFIEEKYNLPGIENLLDDHRDLDRRVASLAAALQVCTFKVLSQRTHSDVEVMTTEEKSGNASYDEEVNSDSFLSEEDISDALVAAIELDECVLRHLAREEDIVESALLQLSPEEFKRYESM